MVWLWWWSLMFCVDFVCVNDEGCCEVFFVDLLGGRIRFLVVLVLCLC